MKTIQKITRSLCSLSTAILFITFLAASAPHRVHHLLENVPAQKSNRSGPRELSLSSAPRSQDRNDPSAEPGFPTSEHDHATHKHAAHAHHHHGHSHRDSEKAGHRHSHGHSHSHSHDTAPVQTQATQAPDSVSEPLHANAPKRDAHHDSSARTDCVVQAAAQQAQLAPLPSAQIVFIDTEVALRLAVRSVNFTPFDPSPFSQRAPPVT
jgi:hypothetical protein